MLAAVRTLQIWKESTMNVVVTMAIDPAKKVFAVHGADATGSVVLRRIASRVTSPERVARLPR
jgi:hypothetical protein